MSHLKHSTRASISTCRWISILLHKENFELICWVSFCTRNTTHRFSKSTSNWFWISISIWVSMGVRLIIPAWCNEAVCCVLLCCGVTWGRQSNAALQLSQLETDRLMARLAMASGKFPFFLPPSAFHQYPSRLLMKTRCSQHKKTLRVCMIFAHLVADLVAETANAIQCLLVQMSFFNDSLLLLGCLWLPSKRVWHPTDPHH